MKNDLIRRQDAIDSPVKMVSEGLEWIPVYHIKELPSAEPKTPSNGSITCVKSEKMHVRTTDDLISRQDAIDVADRADYTGLAVEDVKKVTDEVVKELKKLPSAEPEIIRCRDCKYAEVADKEDSQDGYTCQFHRGSIWFSGSYCSWAERRQDE